MKEEKLNQLKEKIKEEELEEVYNQIGKLLIFSFIGAIIGCWFCKENGYKITLGIFLGFTCPWGYVVVNLASKALYEIIEDLYKLICLITFGIYALIWFLVKLYISSYVGIVSMPVILIYYAIKINKICKTDYTERAKYRYPFEYTYQYPDTTTETTNINSEDVKDMLKDLSRENKDIKVNYEEEYYCERCFKKISHEEYELNDCMCEDCYTEVYFFHMGL